MFFLISLINRTFYIISVPVLLHTASIIVHRGADIQPLHQDIDQAHVLDHIHTIADTRLEEVADTLLEDIAVTNIIDADEVVQVTSTTNLTVERITNRAMMLRSLKVLFAYTIGFGIDTMLDLCN